MDVTGKTQLSRCHLLDKFDEDRRQRNFWFGMRTMVREAHKENILQTTYTQSFITNMKQDAKQHIIPQTVCLHQGVLTVRVKGAVLDRGARAGRVADFGVFRKYALAVVLCEFRKRQIGEPSADIGCVGSLSLWRGAIFQNRNQPSADFRCVQSQSLWRGVHCEH